MTTRHTTVLQRLRSQSAKPKSTRPGPGDYQDTELHRNAGLPDPSRVGGRLYYPGGRVEVIKP